MRPSRTLYPSLKDVTLAAFGFCTVVAAAVMGGEAGKSAVENITRGNQMEAKGIAKGIFNGHARIQQTLYHWQGSHAKTNPGTDDSPMIVLSTLGGSVGSLLSASDYKDKFYQDWLYFHERSHIEYQTATPRRFDAPNLSESVNAVISKALAATDSTTGQISVRTHGAMHERFAEIYGGYALIKLTDPAKDDSLKEFFSSSKEGRNHDTWVNNNLMPIPIEFTHDLGRAADIVSQADFKAIREMPPAQLKTLALREASLAYLVDAKHDEKLSSMIAKVFSDPESRAFWDKAGTLSTAEIKQIAQTNLPSEPACTTLNKAPIKSLYFGSNTPKC